MNLFSGLNFDFLLPGLLKYLGFMLGFAMVGAFIVRLLFHWLPRRLYDYLIRSVAGLGVIAGLYVCGRWFS